MNRIRFAVVVLSVMMTFALCMMTGCSEPNEETPEENVDYEIALVTDEGLVLDGGRSEVAWNTIVEFGGTKGISHKYYKAAESTEDAFIETIREAINHGAKIVIIDNSSMENAALQMQEEYPEIKFAMTDTDPYTENGDLKIRQNTVAVSFDSAQAGYLAGYAAVSEGYTSLGFIGQEESKEISQFGYGYVLGADKAASEAGADVSMQYVYCADDATRDDISKTAVNMYNNGAEVIFASGSDIQVPVIEAAEVCEGYVIGCVTDQSGKSDRVITSAIYNIKEALNEILTGYYKDEFPGGEVLMYNAANDGIGLELRNNKLESLTQDQYDDVYEGLATGEIKIKTRKTKSVNDIKVTNIKFEAPEKTE